MKIEPGFFPGFFLNLEKTRLKPGKKPGKNPVKTRKKPVGKCGEYAESWGSGDVVTDRDVPLTYLPAEKPGKNPVQFSPTPSSPTSFGRSREKTSKASSLGLEDLTDAFSLSGVPSPVLPSFVWGFPCFFLV